MIRPPEAVLSPPADIASIKCDRVMGALRSAILSGELRPGDRLIELRIAERLGTSQTPVREAFAALEREGLVSKQRHQGTFVTELSPRELNEVLTLRAELEGYCASLCSRRLGGDAFAELERQIERMAEAEGAGDYEAVLEADMAFHGILYEGSGHALLAEALDGLRQRLMLALAVGNAAYARGRGIAESHAPLLDALASGDPVAAASAAREHVLFVLGLIGPDGEVGSREAPAPPPPPGPDPAARPSRARGRTGSADPASSRDGR